jgi:thiosulfate/3-mercaptopyruvate sulfurtransferase
LTEHLALPVEPKVLRGCLKKSHENLLVAEICMESTFRELHIPEAVRLAYASITASEHPSNGLLPEPDQRQEVFTAHIIGIDAHVIVYDDKRGGNASRLLWTLPPNYSLLDSGLHTCADEGNLSGFEHYRGYPGSWSEWDNRDDTPKEIL